MTDNFQKLLDELKQNHSSTENLVNSLKALVDYVDSAMRSSPSNTLDRVLCTYMDLALAPNIEESLDFIEIQGSATTFKNKLALLINKNATIKAFIAAQGFEEIEQIAVLSNRTQQVFYSFKDTVLKEQELVDMWLTKLEGKKP